MSAEHKMIEPFSKNQVRFDENGEKLISYGVSSYGYDVRCSNEFKVFTNIHSAVVLVAVILSVWCLSGHKHIQQYFLQ